MKDGSVCLQRQGRDWRSSVSFGVTAVEVGIRFGGPSVMLLKHMNSPIIATAMKLN